MALTKSQSNGQVQADAVRGKRTDAPSAPGARLAAAFEAVERFPALVESRSRVMRAATADTPRVGEVVKAVEADVALTIAVLKALLVILYFMHVRYSDSLVWVFVAAGFFWLSLLLVGILQDYISRGWVGG